MDKLKFESAFKALCISVGYQFEDEQTRIETLRVYFEMLSKNHFTDEGWNNTVNKLILSWKPEYGRKFPTVKEVLDVAGVSPSSIAEKAHKAIKSRIFKCSPYEPQDFGKEHRHFVAMEVIRIMGGWFTVCQSGPEKWEKNKVRFLKEFEDIYYRTDIPKKPLLGQSDKVNQEFLAEYNKNQIESTPNKTNQR